MPHVTVDTCSKYTFQSETAAPDLLDQECVSCSEFQQKIPRKRLSGCWFI